MSVERSELVEELQMIADELGEPPIPDDVESRSEYTVDEFREAFGSWHGAITSAGLADPLWPQVPDEELLAELRRIGDEFEKVPSEQDMVEHGGYGVSTYWSRFGSWNDAVEAAGFSPRADRRHRSNTELLDELQRLHEELGRPPTSREMDELGAYSRGVYRNRWGSWNEALEAAGLDPRR